MRRHRLALAALLVSAVACTSEPAPSPSAGNSVSVRELNYNSERFSDTYTVELLGKRLIAYADAGGEAVLISDGTASGTISLVEGSLVQNVEGGLDAVELDGVGYFLAYTLPVDPEQQEIVLYATDGSAAGTREIDRRAAFVSGGSVYSWIAGIGSGASATLCVVADIYDDGAQPEIDCYRPNEAMRKVELGPIGLSLSGNQQLSLASTGDRLYIAARDSSSELSVKPMTLLSVTATAKADDLAIEGEQFPGTVEGLISLGDGEATLLINRVPLSKALDASRYDLRRLDPDGTITTLISAPADRFGHATWGAVFGAELSADGSTLYLSSYDNSTPESTAWLYAFTRGEEPRVLSTGLLNEAPIYTFYRAPDGRIGALDSSELSWLDAGGLTLAVRAPTNRYFSTPIFLADGSVYLHTYTTSPELDSEADPWYYLPPDGGEPVVFTAGSGLTASYLVTSYAIAGRASVYFVEFRGKHMEEVGGEFVEAGEPVGRLYRFVDGASTELSIDQATPEGAKRFAYSVYRLGETVLLQTLLVRENPTAAEADQTYELFELLP